MTRTIENVPAGEVSRLLQSKGIDPAKPVTVLVDESLEDIAVRARKQAASRGITEEKLAELMKDLS